MGLSSWRSHGARTRPVPLHPAGSARRAGSRRQGFFWEETSLWLCCVNTGVGILSRPGFALG